MDYLKTDAVLWKKEQTADGSRWIESTEGDRERAKAWQDLG
jgi:molybdopterin synthase catalytic subunit